MPAASTKKEIREVNQSFYDALWSDVRLIDPSRFNTWPLIKKLAANANMRLEVGPGMRPRLPIEGTWFTDISEPALQKLAAQGGKIKAGQIGELPYDDNSFDLVCALDIVEHVEDDIGALKELCRVAKPGAKMLLSTPLYMDFWTTFDEVVGHYRRYEPEQLRALLNDNQLVVEQSAGYGMKPKSSMLVNWGMSQLQKNPKRALRWYNGVFMPMGLRFQKPLQLEEGLVDIEGVNEVFMVCRLDKTAA
ncbi:class I SAM-dependent methyltransferase [Aurantivibrio infirmus]